jgi:hypothetical protein
MSDAVATNVMVNIDDDMQVITELITALNKLGDNDAVSDDAVYDFSIRWGTALAGRLPRLVHYSSLRQLTESDELRFQRLCDRLRAVSGLIDRLGLAAPIFGDSPNPPRARRTNPLRKRLGLK